MCEPVEWQEIRLDVAGGEGEERECSDGERAWFGGAEASGCAGGAASWLE